MTNDELIGSTEAATLLGKSPRTVHRMVEAGTLTPALTAPGGFKGAYLFKRTDVEALIKASAA
jgi:excisionase family DNA binding protein